ncbi:hypothetical protein ANCDUO_01523 [Ancylostoma duodenale]|uniref:Fucosyltransferase n=1 Tax=Ancylostoma duodenale TaxID=51022 RepID=A0A0C2DYP5_9BILA|nr:hypothetical protein ANCDUO_01523 [Ancylostoma duodenale]
MEYCSAESLRLRHRNVPANIVEFLILLVYARERPVVIYYPPEFSPSLPSGFAIFHKNGCQVRNCVLTKAGSHKRTADVVLFGENTAWDPHFPRRRNQIWIIRLLESPENTQSLKYYDGKINFTASYHDESDLPVPYGVFERFPVVDIYGSCGKGSLTKEGAQRIIRNNYKFYLAFENSNCRQYITEKFWINALR